MESVQMKEKGLVISTCEMHTCGEPLRIIEDGYPKPDGKTILDKIEWLKNNADHLRRFLMHEPRGHYDMYGTLRVKPDNPDADVGFIFMHNEGYSTMCGHAIIALGRYCVDKGLVEAKEPEAKIIIQCPCGLVPTYVTYKGGQTGSVRFHSVPSFVFAMDVEIELPQVGKVTVDISYGGAFYAFIHAHKLNMKIGPGHCRSAIELGSVVTEAVKNAITVRHPDDEKLSFLYGTIITDTSELNSKSLVRQVTIFADRELDRSPCGSGTSAHIALLIARAELKIGCQKNFQSGVNNTTFKAKAVATAKCGQHEGVIAEVTGNGFYTGKNIFTVEDNDPISGFLVR